MKRFTDKRGDAWCVVVNDQVLEDLNKNAGLNLATLGMPAGEAIAQRMGQDATVVVLALLVTCRSQRLGREIAQDEFAARIEAVYPAARDALLDALQDWATNAATKARLRGAARIIRAEAARPKDEPKPPAKPKAEAPPKGEPKPPAK